MSHCIAFRPWKCLGSFIRSSSNPFTNHKHETFYSVSKNISPHFILFFLAVHLCFEECSNILIFIINGSFTEIKSYIEQLKRASKQAIEVRFKLGSAERLWKRIFVTLVLRIKYALFAVFFLTHQIKYFLSLHPIFLDSLKLFDRNRSLYDFD